MEKKMLVEGMKCNHCKASVEKALCAVAGVAGCEVDLETKTARITLAEDIPDQALMDAVAAKGFKPVEII